MSLQWRFVNKLKSWSSNDLCRVCVTAAVCLFRQRYQSLLDRIPRRLKALHTEVVAQRALDRRLTEEIHHIKLSIHQLSVYVRSDWGVITSNITTCCSRTNNICRTFDVNVLITDVQI